MPPSSPYRGLPPAKWVKKTEQLVAAHPLDTEEIVEVVLLSWDAIFKSKIGPHGFRIGKHLFPKPQIMGFFLHELIPLEFAVRYPGVWRGDKSSGEKDLVFIPDPQFSLEIKTSSHRTQIFGNRSFAQRPTDSKKSKAGYYLAVNFEGFGKIAESSRPSVGFALAGWITTDWIGQKAATGQQARLRPECESKKLLVLVRTHADRAMTSEQQPLGLLLVAAVPGTARSSETATRT